MLKSAHKLHLLGLDLIWLHPCSKKPIELGWTKLPKKTWAQLEASYKNGFNMGVRLGTPLGNGFLACIDCDVKSADPKHKQEMDAALEAHFPGDYPAVFSGRGNGSCHRYGVSSGRVLARTIAQSSEIVKCEMPSSVRPSKIEREKLTAEEIEAGYRLRPAWEISIYGEGRQMVLPPSTHPDTGDKYKWEATPKSVNDFKWLKLEGVEKIAVDPALEAFSFPGFSEMPVDLDVLGLSNEMVGAIRDGEGVEDRSKSLYFAAVEMIRLGFSGNDIMNVLTDREYFLGDAAYDHCGSGDRAKAARWLFKYIISPAKQKGLDKEAFESSAEIIKLDAESAKAQALEVTTPIDWRDSIERTGSGANAKPKNTVLNVETIIKNELPGLFGYNEFAYKAFFMRDCDFGRKGDEIADHNIVGLRVWLNAHFRFEPSGQIAWDAVIRLCRENPFHPVRDYLNGLEWDGVERINTWLKDYVNAVGPEPYLSEVSRKVLCSMIGRVMVPGIKSDHVLILEGKQGCGKSSTARLLGGDWFTDTPIQTGDKDSIMNMRGNWVIELGELSSLRKAEVESIKAFVSQQYDKQRDPFLRASADFPRQCVFIGTTNQGEYLKDQTGNRRFWPVRVGELKRDELKRDRDQLFAEAKLCFELGEKLYLESTEARAQAVEETELKTFEDLILTELENFFENEGQKLREKGFTMAELWKVAESLSDKKSDPFVQGRVGSALRKLGFRVARLREKGKQTRTWVFDPA